MKVCFETFGCRLNRAEALQMEAEYLAKGWELTEKHADADLFVVRGCSVTRRAEHSCERLIQHLRHKYPSKAIRICGCYEEKTQIDGAVIAKRTGSTTGERRGTTDSELPIPTRTARAYLKVQDGCSGACAFCIVPKFRGSSVSVPFTQLLNQAKRFIDAGYTEIVLTGCNLALYASEGRRFPELLAALADLCTGVCRLRIGSLEPGACALETVDVMAEHANICRFLHLPIQTGSNRLLVAMRRPYLIEDVDCVVKKAVAKMPFIGLGCDMMTGFPGEFESDHALSKVLLRRLPFSNAHVFPFSPRPGTPAAGFPEQVERDLSHTRAHELSDLVSEQRAAYAKKFVGREIEIVVEDEEHLMGWTGEYFACKLTNRGSLTPKRKDLVRAIVTSTDGDRLKADVR